MITSSSNLTSDARTELHPRQLYISAGSRITI